MLYLLTEGSGNMQIDFEIIGRRLKQARKAKEYSQAYVAEQIDVSVVYLSRVERGASKINLKRLSELCDLLDISMGKILTGVEKGSKQYLNEELYDIIMQCSPEKQRLIYKIAKIVLVSNFV